METNIVICGVGGQGIITSGKLISRAALLSGKRVVMSEIHGLAQRGGSVSVDVRIGDVLGPIIPEAQADIVIAMEPMEALRVLHRASQDAVFLINMQKMPPISLGMQHREYPDTDSMIKEIAENHDVVTIDALSIAKETGEPRTISAVMTGCASAVKSIGIPADDFYNAMKETFGEKIQPPNITAFKRGREHTLSVLKQSQPGKA